jgi:hypothetical protein
MGSSQMHPWLRFGVWEDRVRSTPVYHLCIDISMSKPTIAAIGVSLQRAIRCIPFLCGISMDDQSRQLRKQLEQLDASLKQTESADEAGRTILHKLQQDIQDLLTRSGESAHPEHPVTGRLRQAIQHFEATHPTLVASMEEIVNTLSTMGI